MNPELVGWASAAMLLATISQQVWTQWKSGATAGVSKWLFVGQTLASLGFAVYSALTGNMVFLVVNCALLVSAIAGELIYLRNRRRKRREEASSRLSPG
jgi:MtN3 and saliva related transmembrane protein